MNLTPTSWRSFEIVVLHWNDDTKTKHTYLTHSYRYKTPPKKQTSPPNQKYSLHFCTVIFFNSTYSNNIFNKSVNDKRTSNSTFQKARFGSIRAVENLFDGRHRRGLGCALLFGEDHGVIHGPPKWSSWTCTIWGGCNTCGNTSLKKKSFAFVKSYLERTVKNLPKAKNCFCMFETLQLFCALLGWGNTLSNVTRTPWSYCLLLLFTVGNLEESVATDKPSQKFRTDEEIVRGDTEQKDGGKWGLFPCKWIQQSNSNRLKSVKISFRFKTHRARDMVLSYNIVLVYRNEIYSPGKLMIAVQLWRRGYWKSPHGPWISRNGTSAWNMRQVIWYSLHISLLHLVGCLETSTQGALNHHHFPFSQELDESGHKPFTSGRWDQFKANEELFGYVSTYKAGSDPSLEMM